MLSLSQTAQYIKDRDNFLIISHHRPDGDALGSAGGLCSGLRELGKRAFILPNPQSTAKYLTYVRKFHAPDDFKPDCIISVDMADENIMQINADHLRGKIDLSIDHHKSNKMYAKKSLIIGDRASCGEIIYLVLMELAGSISAETAMLLYIAVSTDTGCFRYKNTNSETLKTAAALVEAGAPNGTINKKIFMTKTRSRLKLEGLIIDGLEFFKDDELVIAAVTLDMIDKSGANEDDMEDIAAIAGQIEGIETSITITEVENNLCKVSVRTVNYENANEICSQYGGGGHGMAAGCNLKCGIEEAKQMMLKAAERVWKMQ